MNMQSVKKALVQLFCNFIPSRQLRRNVRNVMLAHIKIIQPLARATVSLLIRDFYKDILGVDKSLSSEEILYWTDYAEQHGNYLAVMQTILWTLLSSKEYKKLLIQRLPVLKCSQPSDTKLKVAIWGTNDESKLIFLILTHSPEWEVEINCFVDDNGMGSLYGMPVKKLDELDSTITQIVIGKTTIELPDKIWGHFNKLTVLDIAHMFIILPDPKYDRIDSPQWGPLLGKDIVICSDNATGERLARLIDSLNGVFRDALGETIQVSQVVEDIEQVTSCLSQDQKILIAQDTYSDTVEKLLVSGKSLNDIHLVRYADTKATYDLYMKDGDVFVYTMGKVGSNTFCDWFLSVGIRYTVTHNITRTPIRFFAQAYKGFELRNLSFDLWFYLINHVHIHDYISKNLHSKKLHVITGVRNPLERALSNFFQWFDNLCRLKIKQIPDQPGDLYPEVTEHVRKQFTWEDWFVKEIKANLHIDVYKYPFDSSKGYQIIEENNVSLLIIRLENLNEVWEKAVTEWLGEERLLGKPFTLRKINEAASKKSVGNLYKEVSSNIKFDPAFIEEIYSTQHVKHFYSEDELHRFKQKWINR